MKKFLLIIFIAFTFPTMMKAEDQQPVAILGHRHFEKAWHFYIITCEEPYNCVCLIHDPSTGTVYFPDNGVILHYDSFVIQTTEFSNKVILGVTN
jgi:hypothetical protein